METAIEITVRSTEVDSLGHVNNAKYLEYLEWGREDWYNQIGYSFDKLADMGIGTVTVNININYHNECGKGDRLVIKTRPDKVGKSSFVLFQEIFNQESGKKVSDAHVTKVLMDMKIRKSMPIPSFLAKHLS